MIIFWILVMVSPFVALNKIESYDSFLKFRKPNIRKEILEKIKFISLQISPDI
jgi:hypothetical protein